jgi:hypothetical protein
MPYPFYISIDGAKQGAFKGEAVAKEGTGHGKIAGVRYFC